MRDRRARVALIGLLLAFPALTWASSPRRPALRDAVPPVLATEAVLLAGLARAARERTRLLAERVAPAPWSARTARHARRRFRGAAVGR